MGKGGGKGGGKTKRRGLCLIFKANASEKLIYKTFILTQLMCIPTAHKLRSFRKWARQSHLIQPVRHFLKQAQSQDLPTSPKVKIETAGIRNN